jgi:hypothetical protein
MKRRDVHHDHESATRAQLFDAPSPQGNNDTDAVSPPEPDESTVRKMSEKYKEAAAKAREHERDAAESSSVALPR